MSADNCVGILKTSQGKFIVRHLVSLYPEYLTRRELLEAFTKGSGEVFESEKEAVSRAFDIQNSLDVCEYGVQFFTLDDAGYDSFEDLPEQEKAWRQESS